MRLGLTGDVMLGRLVDRYLLGDPLRDPAEVWGDTRELFASVDARLINLECVIATTGWPDARKTFTFRAQPRAIEALLAARVDFAGLANNHVLDYGHDALLECLRRLRAAGIACAGAGRDIGEASAAAVVAAGTSRVAVLALTDNEPGWEAGPDRPGIQVVRYDAHGLLPPYRDRIAAAISRARETADLVIVCAHIGPNWGPPSRDVQALAHDLLAHGADVYWGHSNHSVQAVEFCGTKAIFYSTGDFLDDYAVDPDERNDLSFFFEVRARGGAVTEARLHPVRIEGLCVHRAGAGDARWLAHRMAALSSPFGTRVVEDGEALVVSGTSS